MSFPLAPQDVFGYEAGLVMGTLIGFAFGFVLERAGFGRAPVLAAQFYFGDNRVLKVMFSAIVTAMLGVSLFAGLGWLDLARVTVPETFLWPQLVGGLLLGAGFIVSGYCPGTAVVGAGSGKLDALITIVGVGAGALVFGWLYPLVSGFYVSGAMGVARLPDLLGLPAPLLALGVMLMAVAAFVGAEALERLMARKRETEPPEGSRVIRNRIFAGFAVATTLTLATTLLPTLAAPAKESPPRSIAALELAHALVERPIALVLLDLRPAAECAAKRLPTATCLPSDNPQARFLASSVGTRTLVVYGATDAGALPPGVRAYKGAVWILEGGYQAFVRDVLAPPTAPPVATPQALATYRMRAALSAHFTGTQSQAPPPAAAPRPATARPAKHGGGC